MRYTTNSWASYKEAPLHYVTTGSDGNELWTVNVRDTWNADSFEYCISYTVNGTTYWANNFGENYNASYRVYP